VRVADLDGDGLDDVVLQTVTSLMALLNLGGGRFLPTSVPFARLCVAAVPAAAGPIRFSAVCCLICGHLHMWRCSPGVAVCTVGLVSTMFVSADVPCAVSACFACPLSPPPTHTCALISPPNNRNIVALSPSSGSLNLQLVDYNLDGLTDIGCVP
jgi:hypothetical protein